MYVRGAKNREEVWLLEHIEAMGLDDTMFRSRDFVVAVNETTNEKAGFGRIRVHKETGDAIGCEMTSVGVLSEWRRQGVGAHIIERLLEHARDEGFDRVYALTDRPDYLAQFGFSGFERTRLPATLDERLTVKREGVAPRALPMLISVEEFAMPPRLRERFKSATPDEEDQSRVEAAEDFGIDPDSATYKYDTGG